MIFQNATTFVGRIAEQKAKREKRLTRMLVLMVVAFNVSWSPYALVCFLKVVHHNFVSPTMAVPGLLFAKTYENHGCKPYV